MTHYQRIELLLTFILFSTVMNHFLLPIIIPYFKGLLGIKRKTFRIETSLGIIDIPVECVGVMKMNPEYGTEWMYPYVSGQEDLPILWNFRGEAKWADILYELYEFSELEYKDGWIRIGLDDGHYGCPEYKVLN